MDFAAFGGATSLALGAPYFSAARAKQPFGLFFAQFQQSPQLRFLIRTIASEKQTVIVGMEWSPRKWLSYSFSGGRGADSPYLANAVVIERQNFTFKSANIRADQTLQRNATHTT